MVNIEAKKEFKYAKESAIEGRLISAMCDTGTCVTARILPNGSIAVGDSKKPSDKELIFSAEEITKFVEWMNLEFKK